jgi:putative transcriptional regulator
MATVKVTPEMMEAALRDTDWSAQDAVSDEKIARRAAADPDAAPVMTPAEIHAARVRHARRQTGLTQEAFADRFRVPLGTLRDWEQGRRAPDAAALAYLRVIEREPEAVARALAAPEEAA